MQKEVLKQRITMLLMKADNKLKTSTSEEFKKYFTESFSPALWELLK